MPCRGRRRRGGEGRERPPEHRQPETCNWDAPRLVCASTISLNALPWTSAKRRRRTRATTRAQTARNVQL